MPDVTLSEMAAIFASAAALEAKGEKAGLEKAATIVEKAAKEAIGTYSFGWVQLAESTQADRARKGFAPNDPLLRTGKTRASYEHQVQGRSAFVGSNSDIAMWDELGTSRMPPRPVLVPALLRNKEKVARAVGATLVSTMFGGKVEP